MNTILNSHTMKYLKQEIKKANISNYSKLVKEDLIKLMMTHKDRFEHIIMKPKKERKTKKVIKKEEPPKEQPKEKDPENKLNEGDIEIQKNIIDFEEGIKSWKQFLKDFKNGKTKLEDYEKEKIKLKKILQKTYILANKLVAKGIKNESDFYKGLVNNFITERNKITRLYNKAKKKFNNLSYLLDYGGEPKKEEPPKEQPKDKDPENKLNESDIVINKFDNYDRIEYQGKNNNILIILFKYDTLIQIELLGRADFNKKSASKGITREILCKLLMYLVTNNIINLSYNIAVSPEEYGDPDIEHNLEKLIKMYTDMGFKFLNDDNEVMTITLPKMFEWCKNKYPKLNTPKIEELPKANQIRFLLLNNDHHEYKKSKLLPYSATTLLKQMFNVSFKKNSSLEAGRRAGWIMYKLLDNDIDLTNEEFLKWKNNKPLESMYQSFINKI